MTRASLPRTAWNERTVRARLKEHDWKSCGVQALVGSNPTLSAEWFVTQENEASSAEYSREFCFGE
jgi:hypothetical protein